MAGAAKQFRPLDGRPLLCWGARALVQALAGPIAVVVPAERVEEGERALRTHLPEAADRLVLVAGGPRRRDSVRAGLERLAGAGTVLVHDAARPFASRGLVERVGRRARADRAVVPALPIRDTLKEVEGDRVLGTVDRDRFVAAQTPQGFPYDLLVAAHEASAEEATDDAALCERSGVPVTWIPGEALNRKLTDPEDWEWAEGVVASGVVRWEGGTT